jgi:radical SAM protein with 4Fe4S-binding SPASM domain
MPLSLWRRILAEAAPYVHTIQFYFQGEPLLNKDLPAMIREAHEAGIYTILSTNAQALTPDLAQSLVRSGLNRIIISMDGLTPESYNAYRIGGDLQKCKDALKWLHDAKSVFALLAKRSFFFERSGPIIELQVLRLRSNEHEWGAFTREYKHLGADRLVFKTAQLYDYADGHPLMPSDPRYSRYIKGTDGRYHRKPLSRGCFRAWSGAVITTTGELLPCCYDKSHAYSFGNIQSASLTDLYNNEKAVAFRKAALTHQHPICQECWK